MKKCSFLLILIASFQAKCQFLPLLQELNMKNPIIIGKKNDLRKRNMFVIMKDIMKENQTICLTTNLTNQGIQLSPGILLDQNVFKNLYEVSSLLKKPWIIVGEVKDTYSRIDKPLYVLENETLWEQFQFKHLKRKNELAEINGNKILWNSDHTKSFLDRRGDFGNVSLIGMTETWKYLLELPDEWEKIAKVSSIVENTFEVSCIVDKDYFGFDYRT